MKDDLVGERELFEQPEDALRAGVVQVVDDQHRRSIRAIVRARSAEATLRGACADAPPYPFCGSRWPLFSQPDESGLAAAIVLAGNGYALVALD
jgi:hypothetical protein